MKSSVLSEYGDEWIGRFYLGFSEWIIKNVDLWTNGSDPPICCNITGLCEILDVFLKLDEAVRNSLIKTAIQRGCEDQENGKKPSIYDMALVEKYEGDLIANGCPRIVQSLSCWTQFGKNVGNVGFSRRVLFDEVNSIARRNFKDYQFTEYRGSEESLFTVSIGLLKARLRLNCLSEKSMVTISCEIGQFTDTDVWALIDTNLCQWLGVYCSGHVLGPVNKLNMPQVIESSVWTLGQCVEFLQEFEKSDPPPKRNLTVKEKLKKMSQVYDFKSRSFNDRENVSL